MLLVNNLIFERNGKIIFQDLNFSLSKNKIIQITGRNGVGKTTLIKILSRILHQKSGDIFWNGKKINKNADILYKNLTLIMDNNTSKKEMTVYENIYFWKKIFSSDLTDKEIDSFLDLLNLSNFRNVKVKYLSFGEARRLELSRIIIEKKILWIIDEPYLGIDKMGVSILNETFIDHTSKGGMIIIASHYKPEITNIETINLQDYENN